MKQFLNAGLILCSVSLFFILNSCNKKDDEVNFVDSYNPPITESKNIVYEVDDYYPLTTGYNWIYDVKFNLKGTIITNGTKQIVDEPDQMTNTLSVIGPKSVIFKSGTKNVIEVLNDSTYQYFQVKPDGIYNVGAYSEGILVEYNLTSPFLKKDLVVGDSWIIDPSSSLSEILSSQGISESEVKTYSKMYVIGKQNITISDSSISALRLDQVVEFSMNATNTEGSIKCNTSLNMKLTVPTYLIKGIGLAKEDMSGTLKMDVTCSRNGQTSTGSMDVSITGNMILLSFNKGVVSSKEKISTVNLQSFVTASKSKLIEQCKRNLK
jgi:hypothetical protein